MASARKSFEKSMLDATPRVGRYTKSSKSNQEEEILSTCYCPGSATDATIDWESAEEEYPETGVSNAVPRNDFNVLANIITVTMLLASGYRPPDVQLQIARDYLFCIKDDDGNSPPNVQGLLNHIKMTMMGSSVKSKVTMEDIADDDDAK